MNSIIFSAVLHLLMYHTLTRGFFTSNINNYQVKLKIVKSFSSYPIISKKPMGNYFSFLATYVFSIGRRQFLSSKLLGQKESQTIVDNNSSKLAIVQKPLSDWNLDGLKQETSRLYLRSIKKSEKLHERLEKALNQSNESANINGKKIDGYMTVEELQAEIAATKLKTNELLLLEEDLKKIKSNADKLFESIVKRAIELEIKDTPPQRDVVKKEKVKVPALKPRRPFFEFTSSDNIIIKVGRSATDNDELSTNPIYRNDNDWWLHVAGEAGSHVVISYIDNDLPKKYPETLKDAALLAAVNSKGGGGRVLVSYTRCRSVSKPRNAKPGLVSLSGIPSIIQIDIKAESARLERLLTTKE